MALLQFMTCGLDRVSIPSSVHCDHLIQAFEGAEADLKVSLLTTSHSQAGQEGNGESWK